MKNSTAMFSVAGSLFRRSTLWRGLLYAWMPCFKRFSGVEKVHRNSIKITVDLWSEWRDSNPRPLGPEPSALPTALHPEKNPQQLCCCGGWGWENRTPTNGVRVRRTTIMQIPIACLLRGFASALPSTLSYYSGLAGICQHVFWSFFDKIWKQRSNEHKIQGDSRNDKIYALLLWLAAAVWLQKQAMNRCAKGGGGLGTPAARSVFNPENP